MKVMTIFISLKNYIILKICDMNLEYIYEGKEIPDNISLISGVSEADSIVKVFKRDVKKIFLWRNT